MDLDELKQKYKQVPMWGRLLGAAALGLLPAAYTYMEESVVIENDLVTAQAAETAQRTEFENSRSMKARMPQLEEELAIIESQLAKARQALPDNYKIEEILERIATIAKETGVKLQRFDPGDEVQIRTPTHYVELPIATEIEGKFSQVAAFFDRVVHLESSIFARKLALTVATAGTDGSGARAARPAAPGADGTTLTPYQAAVEARQAVRVKTAFQLSVYRAPTPGEEASGATEIKAATPGAPGAPGVPGAEGGEG